VADKVFTEDPEVHEPLVLLELNCSENHVFIEGKFVKSGKETGYFFFILEKQDLKNVLH